MYNTLSLLEVSDFPAINRTTLTTLQVNLGYKCNQRCLHCHVNAGPTRTEMMSEALIDQIIHVLEKRQIQQLDLTGGAPEMHPQFRSLVLAARRLDVNVIDRCNLTILFEPDQTGLAEFLAENRVEVVASLPCYLEDNVDKQRGDGVFVKSIEGLQALNRLGYGQEGSGLSLNLVYNPQGPTLPPGQAGLEADYKRELQARYGIVFNHLFALANLPINRFGSMLVSKKQFKPYIELLKDNYSEDNLANVMCRHLISVDWQGYLYDCDFNQQLNMTLPPNEYIASDRPHLSDLLDQDFIGHPIVVADHCFACTAGQGSSCGGAL